MPRPDPEIKQEQVDIPQMQGGPVYVRAIPLTLRFRLSQIPDNVQSGCEVLAVSVVEENGEPAWTIQQWDNFAGGNARRFRELVALSYKLADMDGEEAKKPEGQS